MRAARYEVNIRLWFWCSAVIYLLFMFFWPLDGKLRGLPVGVLWLEIVGGGNFSHPDTIPVLIGLIALFGGPSIVLGWVAHAILLIGLSFIRSRKPRNEPSNPADDAHPSTV